MPPQSPVHQCRCQTTKRAAAVLFSGLEDTLPDFHVVVQQMAVSYSKDLSMAVFDIDTGATFSSARHLLQFLQAQWTAEYGQFKACWINRNSPLFDQLPQISSAQPVSQWAGERTSSLTEILAADRIETWFQPVFARNNLRLWGYECLARARDADNNLISPAELFQWARADDLIFMLDRVCREKHIENIARVDNRAELSFLINFLPTVIYDPKVCLRTTFKAAEKSGVSPHQIIFEVVETEKILDTAILSNILNEYRKSGFRIALDDLGAGHASLSLLGDIAPDLIKLDRLLVSKSTTSSLHESICRSVIGIAREAGKLVLAEGVETEEEYVRFHEMGVDLFQGFLFGKPAPVPIEQACIQPLDEFRFSNRAA